MKLTLKIILSLFCFVLSTKQWAQHKSKLSISLNTFKKQLFVNQEITFKNTSSDTLKTIILNDWNNAYSAKNTPLGKRFSDEFYRPYHRATLDDRGLTTIDNILDTENEKISWERPENHPDLVVLQLKQPLLPNQKIRFSLSYTIKIPADKFTGYGFSNNNSFTLKNCFLTPARFENHQFIQYSNLNLDDCANAVSDVELSIRVPNNYNITTDLKSIKKESESNFYTEDFEDKNRIEFSLYITQNQDFTSQKNETIQVLTNLKTANVNEIQQVIIIDQIAKFVENELGKYPFEKIVISQNDYNQNPFYGLNQLPSFIRPFRPEFVYEITFLKTYLNNYLKNTLRLDPRKDNWIFDAFQIYLIMQYVDLYHPDQKMLGNLSNFSLLRKYKLTQVDFNEQFSYFYMLMARKNLDQPLGESKDKLIKFNEQIASKYRAGLSLSYLDDYLNQNIVPESIRQFYKQNLQNQTNSKTFEAILKSNSTKNIDWFFTTIINSNDLIDYKITDVKRNETKDTVSFKIKNKTNTYVPVPVFGVSKKNTLFKQWVEPSAIDTTYTFARQKADKLVLNFENEVPEYNLRNNWKSLRGFKISNKPVKFVFFKDLEDPNYNQIVYYPTIGYNYYDGFTPGLRINNRTILNKPITFDFNPAYSLKAQTFSGSGNFVINHNIRDSRLFAAKYWISGSYFHYAPDATYLKITPSASFSIRENDLRDNHKQTILARQIIVNREESAYITDNSHRSYSIFNARYYNTKTEITRHLNFNIETQLSSDFGKFAGEIEFRKLFENNHQLNIRTFWGAFAYNKTDSDYFSFGTYRPTDYLFDYDFYGRSENSGFFSQQFILAEGGFKSKVSPTFANEWIGTLNASYSIWNWIELYGDIGLVKNRSQSTEFIYDSGIRLNLVTDYFEVFFPIYSNLGWEISQPHYNEKIRFVITFSPRTLTNLFTRKWL